MAVKELSQNRKRFRKGLYSLAILSFVFFVFAVTLKVNRSAHWYVAKNYGESVFALDILQQKVMAHWRSTEEQHHAARKLINNSIFSKQYGNAGMDMMKDLADDGHAPSQMVYADVLMLKPSDENRAKADYYYKLAAAENYGPAIEHLRTEYGAPQ